MAQTKKKSTGTSKKNTGKKNTRSKAKEKKGAKSLSVLESHRNVLMLTYLFSGIVLGCFAFIKGSNLWLTVRGGLFSFFGITVYMFVAFLIVMGIRIALNNFKRGFLKTNISVIALMLTLAAFIHLFGYNIAEGGMADWSDNFSKAVEEGWNSGTDKLTMCSGILGAVFGGLPLVACGKAGAFVIVLICLVLSVLYCFSISFNTIGEAVAKLINSSKEKIDRTGEETKARMDEKRVAREEKRRQSKKDKELKQDVTDIEEDDADEGIEIESVQNGDAFDFNETEIENDPMISNSENRRRTYKPYQPTENVFTYPDTEAAKKPGAFEGCFSEDNLISAGIPAAVEEGNSNADINVVNDLPDDYIEIIDEEEALPMEDTEEVQELSAKDKKIVKEAADTADAKIKKNKEDVENYVEEIKPKKEYLLPPIDCLNEAKFNKDDDSANEMRVTAKKLVDVLQSFGVETKLVGVSRGPSVTRYELQPAPGVKISKITNLVDDMALGLASSGVRIEAPIPDKSAVGIEVPNKSRATVTMREMIASEEYISNKNKLLNVALGKDITGNITCADLSKMPHLLIAGTTGSGKSVCLNVMIASILYNATPSQVKLIMIDPKQVEFTVYNGIPHLLVPVISDARKAAGSLAWAVGEMDSRYKTFSSCAVRDISSYNKYAQEHPELNLQYMPQIVIFIDELNDLMMVSPKEVEDSICRLAQKARAAGIHLVVATQRPSVDVITGIIKANIPSRISLSVSSQVDSRTILDTIGAEKLLGNGDMLFNPIGMSKPVRIQGAYLSDSEIEKIVTFIKDQEKAEYDDGIMEEIEKNAVADNSKKKGGGAAEAEDTQYDVLIEEAMNIITGMDTASTTILQRKLSVGYARAARIMDQLEQLGYISPAEGNKPRRVLITRAQYLESRAAGEEPSGDGNGNDYDILSD